MYLQYTNPAAYPPLEHSAHVLADAGFDVLMFGTSILGNALVLRPHPRIQVKLRPFRAGGWRQKLHYLGFALRAARLAATWRPSWIYASDPLSAPAALLARLSSGARVIYHEHDSPTEADARAASASMRLALRARRRLARLAEMCVLPSAQRAEEFARTTGRADVLTVWNCPMPEDVVARRPAGGPGLRVLYHGSIVPSRLPLTVVEALAVLPDSVSLVIGGYETAGHRGHVGALQARAAALGIGDRVVHVGTLPRREDLMRQCAGCDVGLALMPLTSTDLNERAMVGASNKPFDYMAGGLALLVSDLPDWRSTFQEPGYALTCNPGSAESIAAALRWFLEHRAERVDMGERGRRRIMEDWNYPRAFAPVMARVRGASVERTPAIASVRSGA